MKSPGSLLSVLKVERACILFCLSEQYTEDIPQAAGMSRSKRKFSTVQLCAVPHSANELHKDSQEYHARVPSMYPKLFSIEILAYFLALD